MQNYKESAFVNDLVLNFFNLHSTYDFTHFYKSISNFFTYNLDVFAFHVTAINHFLYRFITHITFTV